MSMQWVPVTTLSGVAAKEYLDTPVPEGEKRRFRVKAIQGNFTSDFSDWAEGVAGAAPSPVQNLAAASIGTNVQFSAPSLVDVAVDTQYTLGSNLATGMVPVTPADQYFTNFSGDTIGQLPTGWTDRTATANGTVSVQDSIAGSTGNVLRFVNNSTPTLRLITANFADSKSDVDLVVRCQFTNSDNYQLTTTLFGRSSTNPNTNSYLAGVGSATISSERWIYREKYVSGTLTSLNGQNNLPFQPANGQWFILRARWSGNNFDCGIGPDDGTLPNLHVIGTDNSLTSGLFGIGGNSGNLTINYDWVGIGIDGATAPMP